MLSEVKNVSRDGIFWQTSVRITVSGRMSYRDIMSVGPSNEVGYDYKEIGENVVARAQQYNGETSRLLANANDLESETDRAFVRLKKPKGKFRLCSCSCLPCCKPRQTLDDCWCSKIICWNYLEPAENVMNLRCNIGDASAPADVLCSGILNSVMEFLCLQYVCHIFAYL